MEIETGAPQNINSSNHITGARVFLLTVQPEEPKDHRWRFGPYDLFLRSVRENIGRHRLCQSPDEADMILFSDSGPDPYFATIRRHSIYRQHWSKCFIFCQDDFPLPLIPGIYASIEKRNFDPTWCRSGFYVHADEANRFSRQPFGPEATLLYSFIGSCENAPVRQALLTLNRPDGPIVDTSGRVRPAYMAGDTVAVQRLNSDYSDLVRRSRFVLCPRGEGCSSLRLFEAMQMGRAPVIISDDWVEPNGPQWQECSVRVAESDVSRIPDLLVKLESFAETMGARARKEWEQWFSPAHLFETVVDWCLQISDSGAQKNRLKHLIQRRGFLRPFHFRNLLRIQKNKLVVRFR